MSFDVSGYNAQFRNFLDFANNEIQTNGKKGKTSVAQVTTLTAGLEARTITANAGDKVGKWSRSQEMKDANNLTRQVFKEAVAEMFGGEKNIPKKVLDAMNLRDYDKGKPLTARRILAVKAAVDKEITAVFKTANAERLALDKGWFKSELPKIALATNLLCKATGMNELDAIEKLSTPGSRENRLMNYGGRFLESAANFADGLRLMDSFAGWYNNICDTMAEVHKYSIGDKDYTHADTFTKLNLQPNSVKKDNLLGFEKFVFEDLSVSPKANLKETDMEKLFGMKNNKAMSFFGFELNTSMTSTIANIPKEKRAVIYTALNAFTQPAENALQAKNKQKGNGSKTWINNGHSPKVVGRMLRNFDKAEAMFKAGQLTPKNIIKEFFSEIPNKGNYDYKTINNYFNQIEADLVLEDYEGGQYTDVNSDKITLTMESTGCTFEEVLQAERGGKTLPIPQYVSGGTLKLENFDGKTTGGLKLLEGDLDRPANYAFQDPKNPKPIKELKGLLPSGGDTGFGFTFPGQNKFYTNGRLKDNIKLVAEEVVKMCGSVHVSQANNVMMMMSQSGLENLRTGISNINVQCNEHSCVDFTLSKDELTGAVTIKYSSPEALPFKFEWSATIDINGSISTTPMTAEMK